MTADPRASALVREECARAVSVVAGEIFSALDEIAAGLQQIAEANSDPAVRDVQQLKRTILGCLARVGHLVDGAGVVLEPEILSDQDRYLEWWRGPGPQRLDLDLDPASDTFYDYTQMEWFRVPRLQDHRVACGPWVDYSGADQYLVCFARPVRDASGGFLGVAGADVPLTRLEAAVMPALLAPSAGLALVNPRGRVMASNDVDVQPGVLLRSIDEERATPVVELGAGWRIVGV